MSGRITCREPGCFSSLRLRTKVRVKTRSFTSFRMTIGRCVQKYVNVPKSGHLLCRHPKHLQDALRICRMLKHLQNALLRITVEEAACALLEDDNLFLYLQSDAMRTADQVRKNRVDALSENPVIFIPACSPGRRYRILCGIPLFRDP